MRSLRRRALAMGACAAMMLAALVTGASSASASSSWQLVDEFTTSHPACYTTSGGTNDLAIDLNGNWSAPINIGVGEDCTIKELAEMVRTVVGFKGEIQWDSNRPDGTPRKLLDVSRIHALGWKPRIDLERGIRETYEWFTENAMTLKTIADLIDHRGR